MKKLLLQVLAAACIAFAVALHTQAVCPSPPGQLLQEEEQLMNLTVSGNSVHVQNAVPGNTLEVYNVLGIKVHSVKLDAADKTITLNLPKGCYILKIENIVRKIAIK